MSPKSLSASGILSVLAAESLGYSFGKPDRPSDTSLACILPILRETSIQRSYVTLPETEKLILSDSGSIYKVNVKNTSRDNIFLRSGTIFQGKSTQSRALTRSAVVFPGEEVSLDVRCVHQSHGIDSGGKFSYGGITPLSVDAAFYDRGYRPRDQQTMWSAVRDATTRMSASRGVRAASSSSSRRVMQSRAPFRASSASLGRHSFTSDTPLLKSSVSRLFNDGTSFSANLMDSAVDDAAVETGEVAAGSMPDAFSAGSDNLKQEFDAFARSFDSVLSKARLHDHQVGLALITETGCKTVELFDVPLSWEAIHKDAVKRMGTELLRGPDNTSVFEYKPENAVNAVKKVLGLDYKLARIWEHKPSNGEPHVAIFSLTASRYVGEVVEIGGQLMHLVLLEMA